MEWTIKFTITACKLLFRSVFKNRNKLYEINDMSNDFYKEKGKKNLIWDILTNRPVVGLRDVCVVCDF